jgi:hypothetical protein
MKRMFHTGLLILFCFGIIAATLPETSNGITIIAGAETHAMLLPCDCPVNPGGGLAKRAYRISVVRDSSRVLLVDAGGFAGGGLYDSYTEGRVQDSLRTIKTLRSMGAMGYDAAAIGDDDLQYGAQWLMETSRRYHVPLVSANCVFTNGRYVGAPYILVKKGGYTFAVTGLTTQEKLFSTIDSVTVLPPFAALRTVWPEMCAQSDYQIILSHLGEELSNMIPDSFPECAVVVNGHRKTGNAPCTLHGKQLFMQFGFSGKELSYAQVEPAGNSLKMRTSGWYTIAADLPDDLTVMRIVRGTGDTAAPVTSPVKLSGGILDAYIMSKCPYGLQALHEITSSVRNFPAVELHVWFIGGVNVDSSFRSLHGDAEVADEMTWLAIQALYPEQWLSFLQQQSAMPDIPLDTLMHSMGMDNARCAAWVAENGKAALRVHYNRSQRLNIKASPTVLYNNEPLEMALTKPRFDKMLCMQPVNHSGLCDTLPECIDDNDCIKKGMVGICDKSTGKARCIFKDAVRFQFTVLLPDSSRSHQESEVIATTKQLFAGASIDTVFAGSLRGRTMLAYYKPEALPLYLFDTLVTTAYNYDKIASGLVGFHSKLTFKEGIIKKAWLYNRPLMPKTVTVYIDPLFPGAKDALAIALAAHSGIKVRIVPELMVSPASDSLTQTDRMRQEEAQRWLVMSSRYPASYAAYLQAFCKREPLSSYWFLSLKDLHIDVDTFVSQLKADTAVIAKAWDEEQSLGIGAPVEVLIDNREVVALRNQKELMDILHTPAP